MRMPERRDDVELVVASARLAQAAIRELHARSPGHATFEQGGLLDGLETVDDYISHGELGCALSHLLYMIHEADIEFPHATVLALHAMAERLGEPNHYRVGAETRMTPQQRASFFNKP